MTRTETLSAPRTTASKRPIISARQQIIVSLTATTIMWGLFSILAKMLPPVVTPIWAIWLHVAVVLPAVPLGAWILWRPKGTSIHKFAGRLWAMLMLITAVDSYWLRTLDSGSGLGPIHLLSALTLVSVPMGIFYIRRGDVAAHVRAMRGNYIGLCIAGTAALIPGRFLGALFFG